MPVAILSSFSTRAGSRALAGGWGWSDAPQAGQPQTTRPQGPQPPSAAQSLGSGADPRAPSLDPPDSARPRRAGPPTAGNAQHTHDADDGGVDGQGRVHLDLLQCDAHDGQQDDGQVQLVPPGQRAGAAQRGPLCPPRHPPSPSSPEVSTLCPGRVLCHHRAACASPQRAATLSCLCDTPVLEESAEPKGHQLQRGLHDEDDGEHVVAVLEGLVQRLGARGRLVERQAPCPAAPPRPLALLCGPGPLRAGAGLPGAQLSLGGGLCQAGGQGGAAWIYLLPLPGPAPAHSPGRGGGVVAHQLQPESQALVCWEGGVWPRVFNEMLEMQEGNLPLSAWLSLDCEVQSGKLDSETLPSQHFQMEPLLGLGRPLGQPALGTSAHLKGRTLCSDPTSRYPINMSEGSDMAANLGPQVHRVAPFHWARPQP